MHLFFLPIVMLTPFLFACSSSNTDTSSDDETALGGQEEIIHSVTLIQLNDLHAHLLPHWEQVRLDDGGVLVAKRGGLARIAAKIDQIRATQSQIVLMNIGDTYHGGAEAMFSNGNVIVDLVNRLNVDVGVPGNWDYAYGPVVTNARYGNLIHGEVSRPNYPVLAANATYRIPPTLSQPLAANALESVFSFSSGEPFLPATLMLERGGIKLGFIGLTSDIVERMHEMMAFNIDFTQGEQAYLSLLEEHASSLRAAGANVVIVMSELGIHKDWALAKAFDSSVVDIFFSAHTHETTFEALKTDAGIVVVEAGNDTYLGQMDLRFSENAQLIDFTWKLHEIDDDIPEDEAMASAIADARAPFIVEQPDLTIPPVSPTENATLAAMMPETFTQTLSRSLDSILGTVSLPLDRRHALENHFNNAFTDALRLSTGADVAMSPGFRFDSAVIPPHDHSDLATEDYYWETENNVVLNGEFTVADAYRFFPAPYHLARGNVSGERLREVIEENLNAVFSPQVFEQAGGWTDGFSGINISVDLSRANGDRVISLLRADTNLPIANDDVLSVSGCARPMDPAAETTLCSYPGFQDVEPLVNEDTGLEWAAADFLISVIENDELQGLGINNRLSLSDTSGIQSWPETPFYQPLEGVPQNP